MVSQPSQPKGTDIVEANFVDIVAASNKFIPNTASTFQAKEFVL